MLSEMCPHVALTAVASNVYILVVHSSSIERIEKTLSGILIIYLITCLIM